MKVQCCCGSVILKTSLKKHILTKKHVKLLQSVSKSIEPEIVDSDIGIFFTKSVKKFNDMHNKKRELILENILNDGFIDCFPDERWLVLKTNFIKATKNISDGIDYDMINVELKAGRVNNYDFNMVFRRSNRILKTVKCEFKYGTKTLCTYPQFLSMYVKNSLFNVFNSDTESYIHFWYNNYLTEFMTLIRVKSVISFTDYYKHINTTNYSNEFFSSIHQAIKKSSDREKRAITNLVNKSIMAYLTKYGTKENLNCGQIQSKIKKQIDKTFIFCLNGEFFTENYCSEFMLDFSSIVIKNNNTLVFNTQSSMKIEFLLRWKNYAGCSGPAWQIGLKKMK
jgi:hypothetical protein